MSPPDAQRLDHAFSAMETRLALAVGEIASGETIDLEGLSGEAERLCQAALSADGIDRAALRTRFERLSRGLGWLERSLTASHAT